MNPIKSQSSDVTALELAASRLQEYERAVEGAEEMILVVDREYRYLSANARLLEMRKATKQEVVGRFVYEVLGNEMFQTLVKGKLDECFLGKVVRFEKKYTYPEVGERDLLVSYFPIEGVSGIDRVACILHDITERKLAEAGQRESEERFRLMANGAPVMIWMSGPDKRPTYFNQTWLDFTGRTLETELRSGLATVTHPEDFEQCRILYYTAFDARQPLRKECRLRRHDGEYRWVLDVGVPRFLADGAFAGYIGSCIDITDHKLAQEALSTVHRRLIQAQEEERARIARELHDDINQRLAILAVQLDGMKQMLPDTSPHLARQMEEASAQLGDLGRDIQALAHRLHSAKLELLGLAAAASGFCREFADREQARVDYRSENVPQDLSNEQSLCLYRVLQESLQNAIRHSGSRSFEVTLIGGDDAIELAVCDSGIGFRLDEGVRARGLGLTSMRERLAAVDGQLFITSTPQRGTTIRARVPISFRMTPSLIPSMSSPFATATAVPI
jgi:PAS domain S-box-containing protein